MEQLIRKIQLYWQYPVITEKTFYEQNKQNKNYIGIPWATIIDKINQKNKLFQLIYSTVDKTVDNYFTCCQHIHFRNLIPFFKLIHVKTLYT